MKRAFRDTAWSSVRTSATGRGSKRKASCWAGLPANDQGTASVGNTEPSVGAAETHVSKTAELPSSFLNVLANSVANHDFLQVSFTQGLKEHNLTKSQKSPQAILVPSQYEPNYLCKLRNWLYSCISSMEVLFYTQTSAKNYFILFIYSILLHI